MTCELCERDKPLTFHHLIPRTLHSNSWFKKRYTMHEMKTRGLDLCNLCHDTLHKFYPAKTLGRDYNTKEKILADEKMNKAIQFNKKQK
jgi:hypothetical protein